MPYVSSLYDLTGVCVLRPSGGDDTARIQAAVDAVVDGGGGTLLLRAGVYTVSALALAGRDPNTGGVVGVEIRGEYRPPMNYWNLEWPLGAATVIRSAATSGAVLSTPAPGGFYLSGYCLTLRDLVFRTYENPQCTAVDLQACHSSHVDGVMIDVGTADFWNHAEPTNAASYGIKLPGWANGALNTVGDLTVCGYYTGIHAGEHLSARLLNVFGAKRGVVFAGTEHGSSVNRVLLQTCKDGLVWVSRIGNSQDDRHQVHIGQLGVERNEQVAWAASTSPAGYDISDPNGYARGGIVSAYANSVYGGSGHVGDYLTVSGAAKLTIPAYEA